MSTFFDTLKKSFVDVPISADNKISTTEFLEASESLLSLFGEWNLRSMGGRWKADIGTDVLGGAAFKPVKGDMSGNIKVRWPVPLQEHELE